LCPDKWEQSLAAARGPLGALKNRTVSSAKYSRTMPGAPDGEYVVLQYSSQFANKASAVETITPMRDKDGILEGVRLLREMRSPCAAT
jgi:hypothetical protein